MFRYGKEGDTHGYNLSRNKALDQSYYLKRVSKVNLNCKIVMKLDRSFELIVL